MEEELYWIFNCSLKGDGTSPREALWIHTTRNHRGHDAIYVNPYKYLCRWVTKREPGTIMSTSSEYINLGFIKQTISEEWNDGVTICNLRSILELFVGWYYYPCVLPKITRLRGVVPYSLALYYLYTHPFDDGNSIFIHHLMSSLSWIDFGSIYQVIKHRSQWINCMLLLCLIITFNQWRLLRWQIFWWYGLSEGVILLIIYQLPAVKVNSIESY